MPQFLLAMLLVLGSTISFAANACRVLGATPAPLTEVFAGLVGVYSGAGIGNFGQAGQLKLQIEKNRFYPDVYRVLIYDPKKQSVFNGQEQWAVPAPDGTVLGSEEKHVSDSDGYVRVDLRHLYFSAHSHSRIEVLRRADMGAAFFIYDQIVISMDESTGAIKKISVFKATTTPTKKLLKFGLMASMENPIRAEEKQLWHFDDFASPTNLLWPNVQPQRPAKLH